MLCDDIAAALGPFSICEETRDGARVTTHCLYPSFDPVQIFVVRVGEGYRVHDGGGAERAAWTHGRDDALVQRMLKRYAARFQITVTQRVLAAEARSAEWLLPAILAVANAAAGAANAAVEASVSAAEHDLNDRVFGVLSRTVETSSITRQFLIAGRSGKEHRFDFAVRSRDHLLLIDTVLPHHISVSAKYVAFADVRFDRSDDVDRFAVYDRPLDRGDASLLQQVADLVPFRSLGPGVKRALRVH